jgi:hypothetical protein
MNDVEAITIVIIFKNLSLGLNIFLDCIYEQTWPKEKTHLYILTEILHPDIEVWLEKFSKEYKHVNCDVDLIKSLRKPIDYAMNNKTHCFVVDNECIIIPKTIETCTQLHFPIFSPMIKKGPSYHPDVLSRTIKGYIKVLDVCCPYFLKYCALKSLTTSTTVPKYLDNIEYYGYHLKSFSSKKLIICPSAGFGNRLRSIASAIYISNILKRILVLAWTEKEPWDYRNNVRAMQKCGWTGLFDETLPLTNRNIDCQIDAHYSEWVPGEYWFDYQNYVRREWLSSVTKPIPLRNDVSILKQCDDDVICIETSLEMNFGSPIPKEELTKIYQKYFKPKDKYLERLRACSKFDIGISIRRGDLKQYFKEADQNENDIIDWVTLLSLKYKIAIFSDDIQYCHDLRNLIQSPVIIPTDGLEEYEEGFMQFLCLSYNCFIICGTPSSSFAEQASTFGNKPYFKNLDPKLLNYLEDYNPISK